MTDGEDGTGGNGSPGAQPIRLDSALSLRGLAKSRTHAARLIADGLVAVDGQPVVKPSVRVTDAAQITVTGADHYVSRAAHKLIAALDAFGIDPMGRVALDAGASTGGFSQVLLERGAAHVLAVDVGHGQLAQEVQTSSLVTSVEGFNIRSITRDWVDSAMDGKAHPTLVVADLSFISLSMVLEPLRNAIGTAADYVLLVKPQFEVGRTGIREGIVRDAGLRADAISTVLWTGWDLGLPTAGLIPSPIAGNSGNREYLAWLSAAVGSNPTEWMQRVTDIA